MNSSRDTDIQETTIAQVYAEQLGAPHALHRRPAAHASNIHWKWFGAQKRWAILEIDRNICGKWGLRFRHRFLLQEAISRVSLERLSLSSKLSF